MRAKEEGKRRTTRCHHFPSSISSRDNDYLQSRDEVEIEDSIKCADPLKASDGSSSMVVFVDLDRDAHAFTEHHGSTLPLEKPFPPKLIVASVQTADFAEVHPSPIPPDVERSSHRREENLNRNAFSAALSCYPIVKEIARAVDLNTLHALSRTCRQFHVNLAPFRHQLVRETLRCENEYIETVADMLSEGAVIPRSVKSVLRLLSDGSVESGRMTRGKVGRCARDMVGECRRCSKIVCRNCTVKPPSQTALKNRIRRLCRTCGTAPLGYHLSNILPGHLDSSGCWNENTDPVPTIAAFSRSPCTCEDMVWLCIHCGQTLRSNDTTYRRVWTWRTRYSTYLGGGLGTGIGEGSQGVKCGRGEACLAAQEIELEVDCEADEGSSDSGSNSTGHSPASHNDGQGQGQAPPSQHGLGLATTDGHDDEEPGYFRQEMIGLGGVVKHKSKKRVMVGACVVEFEDERETGRYLAREESGSHRAWCGWCERVIPAKNEAVQV